MKINLGNEDFKLTFIHVCKTAALKRLFNLLKMWIDREKLVGTYFIPQRGLNNRYKCIIINGQQVIHWSLLMPSPQNIWQERQRNRRRLNLTPQTKYFSACRFKLNFEHGFNETETAIFPCRLCFLRAFPFISLDYSNPTILTEDNNITLVAKI